MATNPDGTLLPDADTTSQARVTDARPTWEDADPDQAVGGLLGAQFGLAAIIHGMRVQVGSYERILEGKDYGPVKPFKLAGIGFDHPRNESEIQVFKAVIIERAPQTFDDDIKPYIMKGTYNGHTLRCLAKSTCSLGVVVWFGHSNERRAFRTALTRAMLAEQKSDRGGRIVVVPQYFGLTARYMLTDVQNAEDDALAAHCVLQASVTAWVDEVVSVHSPQKVKATFAPVVGVEVES